ncbi:phosphonate dehydrogenase [Halopseudomonas litoralis]|uniref:Phosphonate dehydrogenase n=1 Tax=Halopseudomonas litoralis TaxID=797277 RepID=A0A1H1QJB8_9GAMM|nr:phosphonate dehydrogenase [Halopseudomonas litoralis]SDS23601.1 phosphonate dehydrogenase [Halopseudomonas litoralis]
MKPRVVITHKVHDETLELLAPHCELITNQTTETLPRDEVLRRVSNAQAMMAFMPDRVDADFLDACPQLKVVGAALKGFDNFDVQACTQRDVWLTFVPDLLTVPTAELTVGLTIGLVRQVKAADEHVRSGNFQGWTPQFYGLGIEGSTVGIVGMGAIGKALAQRLKGWGAKVRYSELQALNAVEEAALDIEFCSLEALLETSDIVMLALALNSHTLHTIDASRLALMKAGAFLVNPCRGSVVDEQAVLDALRSGHLGGYAADVFEMEDWAREDRPRAIDPDLLAQPNTVFSAHIGSAVSGVRLAIERRAAENILQALKGDIPKDAANHVAKAGAAAC